MVRRTNNRNKFAFTMIELIFAIVIIAISVISLPMVSQITQKGIESNILQEAIFAASTELMGATSGYWDERSMEDESLSSLSRVIDISGDCNGDRLRSGHISQPFHRRCLDSNLITGLDNNSTINIYSLDDTKKTDKPIFTDSDKEAEGYKDTYTSSIDINRTNNVKIVTATIKSSSGDIITILKTQSANIGEIDYYKRMF